MEEDIKALADEIGVSYSYFVDKYLQKRGKLNTIRLVDLNLHSVPSALEYIDNIIHLDLRYNHLDTLPEFLAEMKLQQLVLAYNNFKQIPQVVLENRHIKDLEIKENNIESISIDTSHLSSILALNVSHNPIQHCSITHQKLRELDISSANLNKLTLNTPKLRILKVGDNPLKRFPVLNLQDLRLLTINQSRIQQIDDNTIPVDSLKELILHLPEVDPLLPDVIKDLIRVNRVRIEFDTSSQNELDQLAEKIQALCRIAGIKVERIRGIEEENIYNRTTRYTLEWELNPR